jgi:hypothetical protein
MRDANGSYPLHLVTNEVHIGLVKFVVFGLTTYCTATSRKVTDIEHRAYRTATG